MIFMTARTHDLFAFAFLTTAVAVVPPPSITLPTLFVSLVANVVGGLIPDLDQASNKLWDLLPGGNFTGNILRHLLLGHRTISHSLLGGFLLFKFLDFALPRIFNGHYVDHHFVLFSIMLGFASHLFADSLTKEGIPLFFPLGIKVGIPPIKFLRVTTDSWVEHIVVLPLVLLFVGYIFINNQVVFLNLFKNISP